MTDDIIKTHSLPKPLGQTCLDWKRHEWSDKIPEGSSRWEAISRYTAEEGLGWRGTWAQGLHFDRCKVCLAASLFDSTLKDEELLELIRDIRETIHEDGIDIHREVLKHSHVQIRAPYWLYSIWRSIRLSFLVNGAHGGLSDTNTTKEAAAEASQAIPSRKL